MLTESEKKLYVVLAIVLMACFYVSIVNVKSAINGNIVSAIQFAASLTFIVFATIVAYLGIKYL